jgi:hypothetical protein
VRLSRRSWLLAGAAALAVLVVLLVAWFRPQPAPPLGSSPPVGKGFDGGGLAEWAPTGRRFDSAPLRIRNFSSRGVRVDRVWLPDTAGVRLVGVAAVAADGPTRRYRTDPQGRVAHGGFDAPAGPESRNAVMRLVLIVPRPGVWHARGIALHYYTQSGHGYTSFIPLMMALCTREVARKDCQVDSGPDRPLVAG